MEEERKVVVADSLTVASANDLVSLECSFLSAQESQQSSLSPSSASANCQQQQQQQVDTLVSSDCSDVYHEIKSQALVDSDNVESTDNEEFETERAAKMSSLIWLQQQEEQLADAHNSGGMCKIHNSPADL